MANERTLILKLDDSQVKSQISQIKNAFGGGDTSGKPKGMNIIGQIFGKNSNIFKNLAKLTIIGAAITAIVKMVQKIASSVVDSSPVLQVMLKLLNTGIMFILRPIGDFIGFFLRPILIVFLRQIALPLYREWGPILRSISTALGTNLAEEIASLLGSREKRQEKIHEDIDEKQRANAVAIKKFFDDIKASILGFTFTMPEIDFPEIEANFGQYFDEVGLRIKTGFQPFLDNFNTNIVEPLSKLNFQVILESWENIKIGFAGLKDSILLTVLNIRSKFSGIFTTVSEFFDSIKTFFSDLIEDIKNFVVNIPALIADALGLGNNGGDTTTTSTNTTNNFFGDNSSQQDYFDTFSFDGITSKSLNNILSGGK